MMSSHIFKPSGKLFACVMAAICFSASAFAAPLPPVPAGCNQAVWNALASKAEAQVAYDVAVTREMIDKPDSVLALTCFSQLAGVSAKQGGAIFSGDFTTQLQTVMPVTGGGSYNCTAINDLWTSIINEGVNANVPYATFDDLVNGTVPPGAGADFTSGWNAAKTAGVFGNLQTAMGALQGPPSPPLDFTGTKSSCEVLVAAQVIPGPCP